MFPIRGFLQVNPNYVLEMYPRYEYANLDITTFEQSPTFEQPPSYANIANFDQNAQFLPEIELSGSKQKCRVCNLDSHGMHFGVMTCRPYNPHTHANTEQADVFVKIGF
ncbi:unnamed protein product [Caenorhabditis sp. 36 PRJEB53466]|nr:unnamed protein product [Caenorhabditis sp. 36 PRJEB53466]